MENLTLEDPAPLGGTPGGAQMPSLGQGLPPQQQLPPQMFTTAAQLLDMTDSKKPCSQVALEDVLCRKQNPHPTTSFRH